MEAWSGGNHNSSLSRVSNESVGFKITKIFFYFIILVASTLGNSLVANIICSSSKMRTASNFLILNLAICDLITPAISIIFDFVLEEHDYLWPYGAFMCKILRPASTYFTTASSLTLAVISLDRYRIIMHPFITRLSSKQTSILVCFIHAFSFVAVLPYAYFLRLGRDGKCEELWPEIKYRQGYTLSLFLVQYGLPLAFMIVMYTLALRALCNTTARARGSSFLEGNPSSKQSTRKKSKEDGEQNNNRKISSSSLKKLKAFVSRRIWNTPNGRAMKMFIIVVTVFAIFTFPNQVVWLWADFGGGVNDPNFPKISIVCWLFTYTNSVVNPIIFGLFSKDFSKGFKRIFAKILCCESLTGRKEVERVHSLKTATESLEPEAHNAEHLSSERKSGLGNIFITKQASFTEPRNDGNLETIRRVSLANTAGSDLEKRDFIPNSYNKHYNLESESYLINFYHDENVESALSSSQETNC